MYSDILKYLTTKYLAQNLIYYKKIDSTQKECWRLIKNDAKCGTLVVSDIQTDGIGTHGRKWYTTEIQNIAFSFLWYPNVSINNLHNITIKIAETLVETIKNLYKIHIKIKYPNDLIINSKKVGGILTETKLHGNIVKNLVVGIGINTNQQFFEEDIKGIATSIKNEFGFEVNNEKIIAEFCNTFEEILLKMLGE